MSDLAYLSATDAIKQFRARTLSPVELLEAVLARADATRESVNAFTEEFRDEARAAAAESARRYAGKGGEIRALEGVPVALKEEQPKAGWTLEEGSLLERGNLATVTHPVVERIFDAGAVVHARTTQPEFACAVFCHTELWGVTRNPWNLECTPGGSSSGAGASLAAGSTTLATGSDIGGSIRIPSSLCGVVGFKPPYGRVAALPPFNLDTYCHDGPMARTVADVALLENVLAGPHPADVVSLRPKLVLPASLASVRGMRIAVCATPGDFAVDNEVVANTLALADAARAAGAKVDDVELPWTKANVSRASMAHFGAIFGPVVSHMLAERGELAMPYTRAFAARSLAGAADCSFIEGLMLEAEIYRPVGELLETYDALLVPTVATTMIEAGEDYVDRAVSVNGAETSLWDAILTIPFNISSRCPVLNVPSGRATNGVPTGVQIVGRTYDDPTVFAIGAALEEETGLWTGPDWRP